MIVTEGNFTDAAYNPATTKTEVVMTSEDLMLIFDSEMVKEIYGSMAQSSGMTTDELIKRAQRCRDKLVPAMEALRASTDRLEPLVGQEYWPMPDYTALLFGMM